MKQVILFLLLATSVLAQPSGVVKLTSKDGSVTLKPLSGQGNVDLSVGGVDSNAWAYATNCYSMPDVQRVSSFISALKQQGLWSLLTDGYLLRSNYQAGSFTQPVSLMGVSGTNNLGTFGPAGLLFTNNSSAYALWTNNFSLSNTVYVVTVNYPFFTDSVVWSLNNASGIVTNGRYMSYYGGDSAQAVIYSRLLSFNNSCGFFWDDALGATSVDQRDLRRHSFTMADNNLGAANSMTLWLDAETNGQHQVQSYTQTNSLTHFMLGALDVLPGAPQKPYYGTIELALVFNTALTSNQVKQVERAVQWLIPYQTTWTFGIDSRSSWANDTNQEIGYPQLMMADQSNLTVYWQKGISGLSIHIDLTAGYYQDRIQPRRPGNGVQTANLILKGGVNDLWLLNATGDGLWADYSNYCLLAKNDGFRVYGVTEVPPFTNSLLGPFPSNPWTTNMTSNLVMFNNFLLSNAVMFDGILHHDLLFPSMDTNNVSWAKDGIHPNINGNRMIANELLGVVMPYDYLGNNNTAIITGTNPPFSYFTNLTQGSLWLSTNGQTFVLSNSLWVPIFNGLNGSGLTNLVSTQNNQTTIVLPGLPTGAIGMTNNFTVYGSFSNVIGSQYSILTNQWVSGHSNHFQIVMNLSGWSPIGNASNSTVRQSRYIGEVIYTNSVAVVIQNNLAEDVKGAGAGNPLNLIANPTGALFYYSGNTTNASLFQYRIDFMQEPW